MKQPHTGMLGQNAVHRAEQEDAVGKVTATTDQDYQNRPRSS